MVDWYSGGDCDSINDNDMWDRFGDECGGYSRRSNREERSVRVTRCRYCYSSSVAWVLVGYDGGPIGTSSRYRLFDQIKGEVPKPHVCDEYIQSRNQEREAAIRKAKGGA